jgi:Na+/proline symporter/signal transduction histidine kinase
MQGLAPLVLVLIYAGLLFGFASWAESSGSQRVKVALRRPAYILALGVYCTSWTYYGAVGSAVADGWSFLPIYLGPILVFVLGRSFLIKMLDAVKADGANSISEFIGGRFGSSRSVAALVTLLALLGSIPYIALQLKSLSTTYALVTGAQNVTLILCIAAGLLALWAMLYGTRSYEASARNDAVLFAVGFESLLKLAALLIVGGLAIHLALETPSQVQASTLAKLGQTFDLRAINADFFIITLLSMAAIICLPRQFFIMVVEAKSGLDIAQARWPFVVYMVATLLVVIPLAGAGIALLPETARPDLYVLELPLSQGFQGIATLVFLGGFSAATAMVLVETIALSTMVSNDLVAPALLRNTDIARVDNFGATMLVVRRLTIGIIMAFALAWAVVIPDSQRLASIGLVAFAAMAQFAPVLLLSVYRSNRDAFAAKLSLTTGLLVWFYTLALPQLLGPATLASIEGSLFNPYHLFGIGNLSPISHGTIWSLGLNLLVFVLATARRVQTSAIPSLLRSSNNSDGLQTARIEDLQAFVARFLGGEVARAAFGDAKELSVVNATQVRKAERLIAGVVGLPSARALIGSKLFGARLSPEEVSRLLDETGQSLRFSKDLLAATLEHIDPGVSVVDRELNVVAWNTRYLDMFNYPPGMVYVGAPVSALISYNALRGECGEGEVEGHVARRLGHMKRGQAHSFERVRPDGRVIKTVGGPMPSGGYVMCFSDITAQAVATAALKRAQLELESRVQERTHDLHQANEALAAADGEKTRFLAAASHDLLQPIHAARLFSSALSRQLQGDEKGLLDKLDMSIRSADTLLRALLDISKLDAGGVVAVPERVELQPLLADLVDTMMPLAGEKGLSLRLSRGNQVVQTDPALLRSIIQNFLSNAIRYTDVGGVLVGIRRRGSDVRIDIFDTGPGIEKADQSQIFKEFERLPTAGGGGIGLGLAIVTRTARLLDAAISLNSALGRGSRFSVTLPIYQGDGFASVRQTVLPSEAPPPRRTLPLRVLIVEDDIAVQDAMKAFLEGLGHSCACASTARQALGYGEAFDVGLIDFNLGEAADGLDVIAHLRQISPTARFALITAAPENDLSARISALDVTYMRKPIVPEMLEAWLNQLASLEDGT